MLTDAQQRHIGHRVDNLIDAGADLAQELQDLAGDLRKTDPTDPDTLAGAAHMETLVQAWETAYAALHADEEEG